MFAARGAGVSLAIFVLLYVPLSLLIAFVWKPLHLFSFEQTGLPWPVWPRLAVYYAK